jgi:hypothetical protein
MPRYKRRSICPRACACSFLIREFQLQNLQVGIRQPDKSEVWLPEYDAFLGLWIFHETLTAGGLELIG